MAAAQHTIDTVEVRGVSGGLDKVTSDLNKVSEAHGRVAQASEEAAKVTDTSAKRQISVASAYERLTAQIDPAFRAQQQMARGQAVLDRALQQGVIDANQYAASLERLRKRYGDLGPANNNLVAQTGNLAAQFNDIAVQLAGGQSPLLIAMQQGTQISQVLGGQGARGAVTALAGAFMSVISPVNLLTIGVIAAGGALLQYFTGAGERVETLDDRLKDHADLIRSIKDAYGDAAKGLDDYTAKSGVVLEAQLRAQMTRLKGDLQRMSSEIFSGAMKASPGFTDPLGGNYGGPTLELDAKLKVFESAFQRLNEATSSGVPNVRGYVEEVAKIAQAAKGNVEVEQMADSLIKKAEAALQAQDALEKDARALDVLGGAASNNIGSVREFTSALSALSKIGLPKLSDLEQAAEQYRKALSDPRVTPEMVEAADREYQAAQQRIKEREREKAEEEARRKAEAEASRAARRAEASEDAFGRSIITAQGRTQQIQEETRLIGIYGGEVEAARLRIELETAAKKRGLEITDAMQRAIDGEVQKRKLAVDQMETLRQRQEALNQSTRYFGSIATDALSDLLIESKSLDDVFKNLAKSIANAALQAALLGNGPLAGLFGTGGSNGQTGGLFGALFKGLAGTFGIGGLPTMSQGGFGPDIPSGFSGFYDAGGSIPSGKWGVVGERRPEIVMGPATVVPKFHMAPVANDGAGGGAAPIHWTYAPTIDARGSSITEGQIAALLAQNNKALQQSLPKMIADARSRTQVR